MKKTFAALAVTLPLVALAAPPGGPPDPSDSPADAGARFERMERRMRLARAMGIAEVLDLSDADAEKVREQLARFDEQRKPYLRQLHESMLTLRHAAEGDKAAQGQVDEVVKRIFEARDKVQAVDRETYQTLAKGLTAEKRARLAVFLAHFQGRFGMGMGPGGGMGRGGMGMGPGGGWGMGPGRGMGRGMGPGPGPGWSCPEDCPWRE